MLIPFRDLKKLPVYTRSGIFLGKIVGFELEAEAHLVRVYFVRKILGPELAISREQVVSITAEKMTVEDTFIKETAYVSAAPSNS
ncbi:PRC-barrel domain-containing protein [Candidatus Uhrbacteria bacterium]|nr:PRC-barrel domain-containing protein [Candidatus Uhrbacteria bacterium]